MKILLERIVNAREMYEEQGFRNNQSTTDGMFIIKHFVANSVQMRSLFICFANFVQAFDGVKLKQVIEILKRRRVDEIIVYIITSGWKRYTLLA